MRLWSLDRGILELVKRSEEALTVREICCLINGKDPDYCINVDGEGSRCLYFYRRPKHESQRIKLVRLDCKTPATTVIRAVNRLAEKGLIKKKIFRLRDPLSTWNRDNFRLVYVDENQIRKRLKSKILTGE
ncbi:MAG: hypothetical protein DRN04_14425 [Thermoprotei archaeon]|nr:MAG: hypothetical protein DRN04_14425 [Thermoprotei archaeon]